MFENSEVKEQKRGASFWLKIGGGVIVVLVLLNVIRINRSEPVPANPTPLPVAHTEGQIVNERIAIEAGGYRSYRINFNHKDSIRGEFRVAGEKPKITVLVVSEENFEKWKAGSEFTAETSIKDLWQGKVVRSLEPGKYFLVFDNRSSEIPAVVDTSFAVK